jgi:hypothetical protein
MLSCRDRQLEDEQQGDRNNKNNNEFPVGALSMNASIEVGTIVNFLAHRVGSEW